MNFFAHSSTSSLFVTLTFRRAACQQAINDSASKVVKPGVTLSLPKGDHTIMVRQVHHDHQLGKNTTRTLFPSAAQGAVQVYRSAQLQTVNVGEVKLRLQYIGLCREHLYIIGHTAFKQQPRIFYSQL